MEKYNRWEFGTRAGLEPAPTDLRHSLLYRPITPNPL